MTDRDRLATVFIYLWLAATPVAAVLCVAIWLGLRLGPIPSALIGGVFGAGIVYWPLFLWGVHRWGWGWME